LLIHKRARVERRLKEGAGKRVGQWDVTWGRFEEEEKRESKRIGHVYWE